MFLRYLLGQTQAVSVDSAKRTLGVIPSATNGTLATHFIEGQDRLPFNFNSSGGTQETVNKDSRMGVVALNVQGLNNYQTMTTNYWSIAPTGISSTLKLELQLVFNLQTMPSSTEDYIFLFGLHNSHTFGTLTDGMYVYLQNSTGGNLTALNTNSSSSSSSVITSITNNAWYTVTINYNLSSVTYTLTNSSNVSTSTTINTNIPVNKYLYHIIGIKKLAGTATTMKLWMDYFRLSWYE